MSTTCTTNKTDFSEKEKQPIVIQKTVEESIVLTLLGLVDTITKKGEVQCQRFGITMNQYLIMLYLAGDPNIEYIAESAPNRPIVASQLAAALNVSRPNITNLLNLLMEKKLISQGRDKGDWRKKPLILTDDAWALLEKMQPRRVSINKKLLAHLSDCEKKLFLSSLEKCKDCLHQEECT